LKKSTCGMSDLEFGEMFSAGIATAVMIVGYLYRQGIEKRAMGYACAVGLVLLIIVMVVNMIQLAATGTFKKEER
jgi:ABC-type sugar transport system permease subunit